MVLKFTCLHHKMVVYPAETLTWQQTTSKKTSYDAPKKE